MRQSRPFVVLVVLALGVLVTACGSRGPLEPPPARAAVPGEPSPPPAAPVDRPFILDGLL